jgi:SPP1 family predicted phage head-tail adaptor
MSKVFDRPIIIQKKDEKTELWVDEFKIHARIVETKTDNEFLGAGAVKSRDTLTFEVRYFKALEDIDHNKSLYQIVYRGYPYDIKSYDDPMSQRKIVKLLGVSY